MARFAKRIATTVGLFFVACTPVSAHPGGGLIAVDARTVIFGDAANNILWRIREGERPEALVDKLHVHWTTLGRDGHIYAESFGEMGGALFRVDTRAKKLTRIAERTDVGDAQVFAVGPNGEIIFQKGEQLFERRRDGTTAPFRGSGAAAKGEIPLGQVIAYAWSRGGDLYLADGANLRRVDERGIVRLVTSVDGKLLDARIWNSTGSARIWSIAIRSPHRIYVALADTGQVVEIRPGAKPQVISDYTQNWRPTAVAVSGERLFILESGDKVDGAQRVRVIDGDGPIAPFSRPATE